MFLTDGEGNFLGPMRGGEEVNVIAESDQEWCDCP